MKISAAIITYNEERNISRALESLRCCDEVVVVDSGSTDRTVELATKLGARVIDSNWRGYAGQKNYASSQCEHDWVLSLDADEALSEALEGEIWQIKKNGPEFDAYTMPRLAQYLGRWILHSGWYPDRKVRLFDRRQAKWVGDLRPRIRGGGGQRRPSEIQHSPLHVQLAVGAFEDHGPLHHARGRAVGGTKDAGRLDAAGAQSALDVLQNLRSAARISGRHGRSGHRAHGGAVQFLEVRQSQEHEPAQVAS